MIDHVLCDSDWDVVFSIVNFKFLANVGWENGCGSTVSANRLSFDGFERNDEGAFPDGSWHILIIFWLERVHVNF